MDNMEIFVLAFSERPLMARLAQIGFILWQWFRKKSICSGFYQNHLRRFLNYRTLHHFSSTHPANQLSRSEVPTICIHVFVMISIWLWCPYRLRATKFEPTKVIKYLNYIISFKYLKLTLKVLCRINRQQRFIWRVQLRDKNY